MPATSHGDGTNGDVPPPRAAILPIPCSCTIIVTVELDT